MTDTRHQIWKPDTGITDIEHDWRKLVASEVAGVKSIWAEQRERLKGTQQLSEFTERLNREWAIETGILENLYDIERGITQTLIEHGFQAEFLTHGSTNRPREYVISLLRDQKDALDGVFDFVSQRRVLSTSFIKELHAALLRSQTHTDGVDPAGKWVEMPLIRGDWKMQPNHPIREGIIFAYCPPEQVASEMDRLVAMHAAHHADSVAPEVEAAWLHHRFSQIHPFQDGNGRVARALASLVLVQDGLFPLVVTREEKVEYLTALEAADEGRLKPLVDLFARLQRRQFRRATAISETILAAGSTLTAAIGGLLQAANTTRENREQQQKKVFEHAHALEEKTAQHLGSIAPSIQEALLRASNRGSAFVSRSNAETSHYNRAQVIENARRHLHYYADTASYRSWVSLNMAWERKARLVFAFHGIGRPFTGSLVCAPFLEFRDMDDGDQVQFTVVPVTDEAFVFFYNEGIPQTLERFRSWRDKVIVVAMKELGENL